MNSWISEFNPDFYFVGILSKFYPMDKPQLLITYFVVILGALSYAVVGSINETVITDAYNMTGSATVEPGLYLELTPYKTVSAASRVLYNSTLDIPTGFQADYYFSVNDSSTTYGDGVIFLLTGMDPDSFLSVPPDSGAYLMMTGLQNFAAVIMDMDKNKLMLCHTSVDDPLPQRPLYTDGEWNATYCPNIKEAFKLELGLHNLTIKAFPLDGTNNWNWTISLDNDAVTTVRWIAPSRTTPVINNEYYFGFVASNGGNTAQLRVYSWNVTALNKCQGNNGGCSLNAECTPIGLEAANCTCLTGYEGDGITCTLPVPPVDVPVSPPTAPIAAPVATPVVQNITAQEPSNGITGPTGPPTEVVVPAVVVPVVASLGVAIFLIVFFVKKRKNNKNGSKKDDDTLPMTQVTPTAYGDVPSSADGRVYNNMPSNQPDEKAVPKIDPDGMKPSDIEARMHIPYKSLVFLKEIGAGSYGKVFLGEWQGAQAAIKVNNTVTDVDGFLAEAKLTLGITPHPNLVRTYGVSLDGSYPCIVLEFCGGGSLDKLVFSNANTVTDAKRKEIALKIAYGLVHLHNNNIVHRDLAVRNILLSEDGQPKVSDFGMSRVIQDEDSKGKTKTNVGPLRWMSPESLRDKTYSVKSDVWSYGILVWELVAGKEPHEDEDQLYVAVKIRDEAYHPKIPENCDPTLRRVMRKCWKMDPAERPTMEEIANYIKTHQE